MTTGPSSMKLSVAALLLCGVHVVFSCTCIPVHPQNLYCSSDIVIIGQIVSVNVPEKQDEKIRYVVNVVKTYKGDVEKEITVTSINSGGLCGITYLKKDLKYLLTGREENDGTYSIALCRSLVVEVKDITPTLRILLQSCRNYCEKCKIQYCGFNNNCGVVAPPKNTCTYSGDFTKIECFNKLRCVPRYNGYDIECNWTPNNC